MSVPSQRTKWPTNSVNKVTVHPWIRSGKLPATNLDSNAGYRICMRPRKNTNLDA